MRHLKKGLTLKQETDYPRQQGTALTFDLNNKQQFDLKVRYPCAADNGVIITVNGETTAIADKVNK